MNPASFWRKQPRFSPFVAPQNPTVARLWGLRFQPQTRMQQMGAEGHGWIMESRWFYIKTNDCIYSYDCNLNVPNHEHEQKTIFILWAPQTDSRPVAAYLGGSSNGLGSRIFAFRWQIVRPGNLESGALGGRALLVLHPLMTAFHRLTVGQVDRKTPAGEAVLVVRVGEGYSMSPIYPNMLSMFIWTIYWSNEEIQHVAMRCN